VKRAFVLVLVAACGHKSPKPAVADQPGSGDVPADHAAVATPPVAPADAPPAPGPVVPAPAGDGSHAFVADESGLIEIAPSGKTQAITTTRPRWCTVDARANVVWFAGDSGIQAFDLADRRVHAVIRGDVDANEYVIDWGNQQAGGEDQVGFDVGLAIHLTAPPSISSVIGCDGDAAYYCYEGDDMTTLKEELAAKEKAFDAMHFADPAYVKALADRGASGTMWTPPPVPPAPPARKPKVKRKACEEEPKDCGQLAAIPASRLWLVTTANSRGDFFHETRELWDPATGEYVSISGGTLTRAKTAKSDGGDFANLRVAPDGLLSIDGVVFDPAHVIYAPKGDGAISCGWTGGGWRMPGPRG
jgi:hypothetical protein